MVSTLGRMARFLLANANPSIKLRLKQELRHPLALCQAVDDESPINNIRPEPVYKLIASCQKPNGWLGNRFHGPNRDAGQYENQEVGTKWLAEKWVGRDDPVLSRAMDAFVTVPLDSDGICRATVDEEQLRGISTYSGQQLEVDWKSETRRLCDITFRAALCIYYAGL